ncbi:unnamed protein product [Bursaphelenchus okinawaensis]|uniref:Piwi domain-containing protein n=1 Tax=Bursaphelenchus okinawaensis TaxID=465554 RepID=A0A811KJA7_9BILA|nr:unnamed protein product [Bursaphelenchus okinawaensis]CAG9103687.1 unnamed protein product [Bursaphelenchus okinawaensis]
MALASITASIEALTLAAKAEKDAKALCDKKGVVPSDGSFPKIMAPGKLAEGTVNIKSNVFPMKIQTMSGKMYMYSLVIYANYQSGKDVIRRAWNAEIKSDYYVVEFRRKCFTAWQFMIRKNPNIFPPAEKCAYDCGGFFYTSEKLDMPSSKELLLSVKRENDNDFPFSGSCTELEFLIKERDYLDLEICTSGGGEITDIHKLERCMDVVTNMAIMEDEDNHVCYENNTSYLLNPGRFGFRQGDAPSLPREAYVGLGCSKSVHIFRTEGGTAPAMVIETKKTPFHNCLLVSEKLLRIFPKIEQNFIAYRSIAYDLVKGLVVSPVHSKRDRPPVHQVKELSDQDAHHTTFKWENQEITVFEYFKQRHGIELVHHKLPLLVSYDREKKKQFLPMELFMICDNQRVKSQQSHSDQIATLIKVCAVLPRVLEQQVYNNASSLHLLDSQYLSGFGAQVGTNPICAVGRLLPHPGLMYRNQQISQFDPVRGNWRSNNFCRPSTLLVWGVYVFDAEGNWEMPQLKRFAEEFYKACLAKGMQVNPPKDMKVFPRSEAKNMGGVFARASDGSCQFIFFITSKLDNLIHRAIKYNERKYGIVTQNVLTSTAAAACGLSGPPKRLTMENLVNKANVKLGGLNYHVADMQQKKLVGEDDLFIGFAKDIGAAASGSAGENVVPHNMTTTPTVVGYAANDIQDSLAFTGDFVFQEGVKQEKLSIIVKVVNNVLKRYEDNRGKKPQRVFIYRNAIAESSYPFVLKYEIPLLKDAVKKAGVETFVYLVPNRLHNVRVFPAKPTGEKPPEQNLKPGTVLDSALVSANITEFFLCGHVARLGTAKVPRYSVLSNESNVSIDELQKLTYHLSYGHQIVTGATALPSPVFIAKRYAERGRLTMPLASSEVEPKETGSSSSSDGSTNSQVEHLNAKLQYAKSTLRNQRVNA